MEVKSQVSDELRLGPYFATQVLKQPRHMLFSLSRYKFAAKLLSDRRKLNILELGCNEGIGTLMFVESGHTVKAIDFDPDAVSYAQQELSGSGVDFQCDDFLGKTYGEFDGVVSLDVIEHIEQRDEDQYVQTICDNLSPSGMCAVGTPNLSAEKFASEGSKVGHVNVFDHTRLVELFDKYFHQVFLFGMNDEMVHTGFYPMCHYLMVIGCHKRG